MIVPSALPELLGIQERNAEESRRIDDAGGIAAECFFGLTSDLLCVIGDDGFFKQLSPNWESVTGYKTSELLSRPLSDFIYGADVHILNWLDRAAGEDSVIHFENRLRCKDGSHKWVGWSVRGAPDDSVVYAALHDLTGQRQSEEKSRIIAAMSESEKLKDVGRLAAGIAHEVKNPLAVVQMGINYLTSDPPPPPDAAAKTWIAMRRAVERAESIIHGLLRLASPNELKFAPKDVNEVVGEALGMVRHKVMASHVELVTQLDSTMPQIWMDAGKIEQVLVNVLLNACDSIAKGGVVTVRTYQKQAGLPVTQDDLRPRSSVPPGTAMCVIEINDTGAGISTTDAQHLFEPFFTTKCPDQGTGLGLAVCRQIMELHYGAITIRNRREGGAQVCIMLKRDLPRQESDHQPR